MARPRLRPRPVWRGPSGAAVARAGAAGGTTVEHATRRRRVRPQASKPRLPWRARSGADERGPAARVACCVARTLFAAHLMPLSTGEPQCRQRGSGVVLPDSQSKKTSSRPSFGMHSLPSFVKAVEPPSSTSLRYSRAVMRRCAAQGRNRGRGVRRLASGRGPIQPPVGPGHRCWPRRAEQGRAGQGRAAHLAPVTAGRGALAAHGVQVIGVLRARGRAGSARPNLTRTYLPLPVATPQYRPQMEPWGPYSS